MAPRTNLIRMQDVLDEPPSPMMNKKIRPLKVLRGEKKRVHFLQSNGADEIRRQVHEVPALADLSEDEKRDLWLTRQDLQHMDELLRLDLMRSSLQHHRTELGDNPLRGLEWKTFDGVHQRNNNRKKGLDPVLEEQRRLKDSHYPRDLQWAQIARLYHEATSFCLDRARSVAIQDEQIASQIRREDIASEELNECQS